MVYGGACVATLAADLTDSTDLTEATDAADAVLAGISRSSIFRPLALLLTRSASTKLISILVEGKQPVLDARDILFSPYYRHVNYEILNSSRPISKPPAFPDDSSLNLGSVFRLC